MLTAVSPIDGRYAAKVKELSKYFSEYALFKYRVIVEIKYFIDLSKTIEGIDLSDNQIEGLHKIIDEFEDICDGMGLCKGLLIFFNDIKIISFLFLNNINNYLLKITIQSSNIDFTQLFFSLINLFIFLPQILPYFYRETRKNVCLF